MSALETIFRVILDVSWRTSCVILPLLALRAWLRGRLAARLVFAAWVAIAARLLLPISFETSWSPFPHAAKPPASLAAIETHGALADGPAGGLAPTAATAAESRASGQNGWKALFQARPAGEWAAQIWLIGVLLLLSARLGVSLSFALRLRRLPRITEPSTTTRLQEAMRRVAGGELPVIVTPAIKAPALYGLFRPRVLLPPGLSERLTDRDLELLLAHEIAHARRRDLLADGLLHFAAVLHWFNPAAWLAARVARNDCELACDEHVLGQLPNEDRGCYGTALINIVSANQHGAAASVGLGVVESKSQLKRRIQMIATTRSTSLTRTRIVAGLFAGLLGLSLTHASSAPAVQPAPASAAAPNATPAAIDIAAADRLDAVFPKGIAATVGDRTITVADIRREVAPLLPKLAENCRTQEEFNGKLMMLQNNSLRTLVERAVLIQQFHDHREGESARQIPEQYVDRSIAEIVRDRFNDDRTRFLEYLKERNMTVREFRQETEENIIYSYMRGQERKLSGTPPVPPPAAPDKPVHLRIIQLTRGTGETDAALREKATAIVARFNGGESFEQLAREFDQSKRRERGGDWGWLGDDDIRAEYREAFSTLKKGDVSAPILAAEGCFLLYAEERR